jgi:hypothetical protein
MKMGRNGPALQICELTSIYCSDFLAAAFFFGASTGFGANAFKADA